MLSGSTENAFWEYGRCYLGVRRMLSGGAEDAIWEYGHAFWEYGNAIWGYGRCTPIVKSPTVSGSGHFLCSPLTKIGGRLRLFAPP